MEVLNSKIDYVSYFSETFLGGSLRTHEQQKGSFGPIIGLHGVFGGWPSDSLRAYMKKNSIKGVLPYLGPFTRGIESSFKKIDELVKKYPRPYLFGYSFGGIAMLLWTQRNNAWSDIEKIITVGTPLSGIDWYEERIKKVIMGNMYSKKLVIGDLILKLGKSFSDVMPSSQVLKEVLNINPPEGKVFSFFSQGDEWTPDPKALKLNWPTVVVNAGAHEWHPRYKWIENMLDSELGVTPVSLVK